MSRPQTAWKCPPHKKIPQRHCQSFLWSGPDGVLNHSHDMTLSSERERALLEFTWLRRILMSTHPSVACTMARTAALKTLIRTRSPLPSIVRYQSPSVCFAVSSSEPVDDAKDTRSIICLEYHLPSLPKTDRQTGRTDGRTGRHGPRPPHVPGRIHGKT